MTRKEAVTIYIVPAIKRTWNDKICKEILEALEQEPKTGYIAINDVMSVFDDFMCGEVDEDGTDTFLEMLRDKEC